MGRARAQRMHRCDLEPEIGDEADPVHPRLEQRTSTRQRRLGAPTDRALLPGCVDGKEANVAEISIANEAPQPPRDRLVDVVLGDEDTPSDALRLCAYDVDIGRPQECG